MKSITSKISKKLVWIWFNKEADKTPTHVDTFHIDIIPPEKPCTYSPKIVIKSGNNEEGAHDTWAKQDEPLMIIECDGDGFDVEKISWNEKPNNKFRIGYAEAQYLLIGLKLLDRVTGSIRGSKDIYKYFKGDLKDILPKLLEEQPEPIAEEVKPSELRPLGDVTCDLEVILNEMSGEGAGEHRLQKGEVLALVSRWFDIHNPGAIETYVEDSSHPEEYYGYPRGKK